MNEHEANLLKHLKAAVEGLREHCNDVDAGGDGLALHMDFLLSNLTEAVRKAGQEPLATHARELLAAWFPEDGEFTEEACTSSLAKCEAFLAGLAA